MRLPPAALRCRYGLFKQATVGDNSTSRPGIFDPKGEQQQQGSTAAVQPASSCQTSVVDTALRCPPVCLPATLPHLPAPPPCPRPPTAPAAAPAGKAKWDAWDKQKGKSAEAAMQEYIALVASLKAKYA